MGEEYVFSLHQVATGPPTLPATDNTSASFSVKHYQHYLFGDNKQAQRYGSDLAKAYIARLNPNHTSHIAVALLPTSTNTSTNTHIPTATHTLRAHFTAHLNAHLDRLAAPRATTLDIAPTPSGAVDTAAGRSVVLLGDIRLSAHQETGLRAVLSARGVDVQSDIVFLYVASFTDGGGGSTSSTITTTSTASLLSHIISPSLADVEALARGRADDEFVMNECFVRYVLGQDEEWFVRFVRRAEDAVVGLLREYAVGGGYSEGEDDNDEMYGRNVGFLCWEVRARECV